MMTRRNQRMARLYAELSRTYAALSAAVLEGGDEAAMRMPATESAQVEQIEAAPRASKQQRVAPLPSEADSVADGMSKTARKILVALAQLRRPLDRKQLGIMTGLSASTGPFGVALAQLRRDGLIAGGGQEMTITPRGISELGDWTPLPVGHALFEYWAEKLGSTAEKILRALRRNSGRPLSRTDLGVATGLSPTTGPFGVALAELRRLQLIAGGGTAMTIHPDFARAIEPTINVFDTKNNTSVKLDARNGYVK